MTTATTLTGTIASASPYLVGFDIDSTVSASLASQLHGLGYRFCVRYVSLGAEGGTDLTAAEAKTILAAGLALMPVQHVDCEGWTPTQSLGKQHGQSAAANATAIGFPAGVNLWMDLEGVSTSVSADDVIAYASAWYDAVKSAGFVPGLYVGALSGLSSSQLGALEYQHYWRSLSTVPDVQPRGYQMVQSAGTSSYDNNRTQSDNLGGEALWLTSGAVVYPMLKQGMKGAAVGSLQMALNAAGASPPVTADQDFGAKTFNAVEAFQRAHGLSVDGIAGTQVWGALVGAPVVAAAPSAPVTVTAPPASPSTAVQRMPISALTYAIFSKILGLLPAETGEDLDAELAVALGALRVTTAGVITPGDLGSIVAALHALSPQATSGSPLASRLAALTSFYQTQAALPAAQQASRLRLCVVSEAMSQIGTVIASKSAPDPEDPTGPAARSGYINLNELFETSFGDTSYGVSSVKSPTASLMSWCGLFGLWANKTSGLSLGTWKIGCGISAVSGMSALPAGSTILPGDIGYVDQPAQHHYIVAQVNGSSVTSVDGNHSINGVSGQIGMSSHSLQDTAVFYRASGLG